MSNPKIWFTADLHFNHNNILKYSDRNCLGTTIEDHDSALIELWNNTVSKKDIVYILGDLFFGNSNDLRILLTKLRGNKVLIEGNHDSISDSIKSYFNHITLIKNMVFKKSVYPFLEEDFKVVMCHYPILSWENKSQGTVMLHGHCHGRIDHVNTNSKEFRVDVGFDGELAKGNLVSLEQLYDYFCKIKGNLTFKEYAKSTLDVT